jgi:hypothetical protein
MKGGSLYDPDLVILDNDAANLLASNDDDGEEVDS